MYIAHSFLFKSTILTMLTITNDLYFNFNHLKKNTSGLKYTVKQLTWYLWTDGTTEFTEFDYWQATSLPVFSQSKHSCYGLVLVYSNQEFTKVYKVHREQLNLRFNSNIPKLT